MFRNLSHKRKFYLLLGSLALFLIVAYNLAIKKTVVVISEYSKVENEIKNLASIPSQIKKLREITLMYNNQIEQSYSKLPVQVFVLEYVADFCKKNSIIIKEFPKTHYFVNSDYTLETSRLLFKGNFVPILKLIYNIEQEYRIGKVSSVKFYKVINNKTKTPELYADIYIQKIKRNELD